MKLQISEDPMSFNPEKAYPSTVRRPPEGTPATDQHTSAAACTIAKRKLPIAVDKVDHLVDLSWHFPPPPVAKDTFTQSLWHTWQ